MIQDPAATFVVGSLAGHWVATALFGSIALFIGCATARIARQFAAPPGHLAFYGTSFLARRVLGTTVTVALLLLIWAEFWTGWHEANVEPAGITLRYSVPPRERLLSASDIEQVRWDPGYRGARTLVIMTRDGRSYPSLQASLTDEQATATLERLRAAIDAERR